MDELLNTFLDEADEHLAALENGLLRVIEGKPDLELLNEVFRAAHSIKGGSGVFGFEAITRLTHSLETLLDRLRKGELPATRERIDLLLKAVDELNSMFAAARVGSDAAAVLPEELIRTLYTAAGVEHATAPAPVRVAAPTGPRDYRLAICPGPQLLTHGIDPLMLLRNLGKRGTILGVTTDLGAIPSLDSMEADSCYLSWTVTIRSEETQDTLRGVFQFVEDDCAVAVSEFVTGESAAEFIETPFRIRSACELLIEFDTVHIELLKWVERCLPVMRSRIAVARP